MEKDNRGNLSLENLYPFRSSTFFKKAFQNYRWENK